MYKAESKLKRFIGASYRMYGVVEGVSGKYYAPMVVGIGVGWISEVGG